MKVISSKRVFASGSDNPKAAPADQQRLRGLTLVLGLLTLVLAFAGWAGVAGAQPKKVPRIGYLVGGDAATESARAEAIRLALRERGYIEGQNIAIEYRYAEGNPVRQPELAAELVRLKVDIIVAAGGGIIQAAKNATKSIPVVMAGSLLAPIEY